jgi:hypothetical protein
LEPSIKLPGFFLPFPFKISGADLPEHQGAAV